MSLRGRPERSCDLPMMTCSHYPDDSQTQNCGSAAEDGLRWRSDGSARKGVLPGRSCGSAAEDVTPRPNCGSDLTAC